MIITEFLQEIAIKGWKLWSENGKLRYRAPNDSDSSAVLEQLKTHKTEILELLQEQPELLDIYPLSHGQKSLWLINQLAPESAAYNVAFNCRISSEVDVATLEKVFHILSDRHPILRSTFPKLGAEPIQKVHHQQKFDFQQIQAENWDAQQLKQQVITAYQVPFDLENQSAIRVRLFTVSEKEHILLIVLHHLIGEGWSIGILLEELKVLYPALKTGQEPSLPPVVHSHETFVQWQQTMLESSEGEKLWNYWQQQLAGDLPVLDLPTDKPRPPIQTYNGASYALNISEELTQQLKALAQSQGTTLYTVLLAAFQVLLHRYTDQEDILLGSPTASRHRPEFTQIIGYLVNPVVMRANLSGNPSFKEFLNQVRSTVLSAIEHQDYPFPLLVERLKSQRDLSRSPIFQACFVLQKLQQTPDVLKLYSHQVGRAIEWGGLRLEPYEMPQQEGQFDLTLELADTDNCLVGVLKYNADLLNEETSDRIANHLQTLLTAVVKNPELPVGQLEILTESEKHQLLKEWNQTNTNYPLHKCIHQLFEEQVERNPQAVAVVYENQQLTYQQLNEKANQLAHYLQSLGVKPEVLVGLCTKRSLEMIVGLLGILKAGGAYVPLDPNYPTERLSYMLLDANVPVLLTQDAIKSKLQGNQSKIICLDTDWEDIAKQNQNNPVSEVGTTNLAYVIYTSGSTGKPKGTEIIHQGLVNYLSWCTQAYQVKSGVGSPVHLSIAFDATITGLFSPLMAGKTVFLLPEQQEIEALVEVLRSHSNFSFVKLTPAHLQLLNSLIPPEAAANQTRYFIIGGEALSPKTAAFWLNHAPETKLINEYGPTETVVGCCVYEVKPEDATAETIAIGKPIANTQLYILDPYLQPVPIGVAGELYIGGAGVARGYHNQPELTAQKFITNPFGSGRLYKTGDLARYKQDGNIEFLGRIDHQVKIRGFRIELGEIESILSTYPQVQQVVVIDREDHLGDKRLVAYLVTADAAITPQKLRNFLQQQLPEYMIPSAFVLLDSLPLTHNGKVDRKALPVPEGTQISAKEFVPPQNLTQELIANIFTAVLGVSVGIHDNFFELGGHSILATQIITKLRQAFEVEVPLRSLFQSPTVAQLEQVIHELRQIASGTQKLDSALPEIVPNPEQRYQPFPLTDIQQAYWLGRDSTFDLGNVATHTYFEVDCENLNLERLNQAWQQLVKRHDMLRAIFLANGQQQILESVPPYQFAVVDFSQQSPQTVTRELESIRQEMSHHILPADKWPLFEIRSSILAQNCIRLHLSIDALIADAWSLNLIGQQWWQLYQNIDSELPKIEVSFSDYIFGALAFKDTPQYQRDRQYWLNRLSTLPPAPELPLIRNLDNTQAPKFQRHRSQLSPENWQKLKNKAVQVNLTPSIVLLAAFGETLSLWSKSPKFTLNLTLFNRLPLHPQVNELVGDFTSLNLLEVDNSLADSFTNRAQRLQQQLWQDLEHQYFSGVEVQRELRRKLGSYQPMGVVFTSILGLNSLAKEEFSLKQLGELVYGISQTPQVWLDHQVYEEDGTLIFNWDAIEELFPVGMLDDMFATYCQRLQNLATSDSAWKQINPELLPSLQRQLIAAVNETATEISTQTLHGLFLEQVKVNGEAIAIITPNRNLTYQQLYNRANKLAHQLREVGAKPNQLIAVAMQKGWEQIVAVLGILISGAAYLPIDVELPDDRRSYLLEKGQVKTVLTQSCLKEKLALPTEIQCLLVDFGELGELDFTELPSVQKLTDLAYVIYTSGSTGLPKGVMIDHQGAVNTILDINQRWEINEKDRVLALSALNFDLSVYDIFGILAAGGSLVIPAPEKIKDPHHWLELIITHKITLWNTVPALMQMLVEYLAGRPDTIKLSLQLVLLSGDWIPLNLPTQIQAIAPNAKIISLGGATEASIWSIYYPIQKIQPNWNSIPYGKPLQNQRFYLLNEWMQPCPTWVPGQLYIAGIGLAQGYWKNPEKTAASFITHPVTQEKLYKTGDLGRYLPDGNIEFLGREDFQVKINGYRVELGEIEVVLRQHPEVKEAIVTTVGEAGEQKRLVAYIIPDTKALSQIQPTQSEASDPQKLQGVIVNPLERIEFKLQQPGLRKLSPSQPTIALPKVEFDQNLNQAYLARQSYRQFLNQPISLAEFSRFLSCLIPMPLANYPLPKYRYPSAGSLYPVQTYILVKPDAVERLNPGFYYYDTAQHCLVLMSDNSEIDPSVYGGNQAIFENSTFAIFLIGQLKAISPMYGELAQNFCFLEAGHIGQLLMQQAPNYSLGLCPIGYLPLNALTEFLDLEPSQILLYSFAGGKIDLAQTQQWFTTDSQPKTHSLTDRLRDYLRQKLPEYMIPKAFMELEAFPLSANGKINYKGLPKPDLIEQQTEKVFIPPRSPVEAQLVEMLKNLLNLEQISIDDNFFDLGGDSLLATRLISRIREVFKLEIPLRQFFDDPSIGNIAEYIETINWMGQSVENNQLVETEIEQEEEEI